MYVYVFGLCYRNMNMRDKEQNFEPDELTTLKFPSLETVLLKTQTPYPRIDAKVQ